MVEIFKSAFLNGFGSGEVTIYSAIIAISITCIMSLYIFFLYKAMAKKTFYSKSFNISLVFVSCTAAAIICTVQSSVAVSLGMVGALSIIRFRTAIKDPMDLAFLFWSVAIGIICGAGFAMFAIVLSIVLTIVIILLNKMPIASNDVLLVVNSKDINKEEEITNIIKKYTSEFKIASRNLSSNSLDLTYELKTNNGDKLSTELVALDYVEHVNMLKDNGDNTF